MVSTTDHPANNDAATESDLTNDTPNWHILSFEACTQQLEVNPYKGLKVAVVNQRRDTYSPNELVAAEKEPFWRAFLRQFKGGMLCHT